MTKLEKALTLAVADLLLPICLDRVPVVVPYQRRRAERQVPATILQTPADVNVVTRLVVDRVKASYLCERPPAKSHVAARYVLGDRVVEEHVRGTTGAASNALRNPAIVVRHDIRPTHSNCISRQKRLHQIRKPIGINTRVGIAVRHDLSRGGTPTQVSRRAQPPVRHA